MRSYLLNCVRRCTLGDENPVDVKMARGENPRVIDKQNFTEYLKVKTQVTIAKRKNIGCRPFPAIINVLVLKCWLMKQETRYWPENY